MSVGQEHDALCSDALLRQDSACLRRRIHVARGQEPGDLLLSGGQIVNVFTQRLECGNVVVADGWIAGVGPYEWPARQTVALDGRCLLPGLLDAHMHLESTLLTPGELARLIVPRGTTAIISDSHEIANVLGIAGIDLLLAASAGLPFDLFFMASSCVPATRAEQAGAVLGAAEVGRLLERPRVLGLAEVMDIPAVLSGADDVLEKLATTLRRGLVLDGHAPGLTGQNLQAYAAAGMRSDHESASADEARAKAAAGMLIQVREGSSARNLEALLPLLASGELGDFWCLVTDDIFPDELRRQGHLDDLLRRVVAGGVAPAAAVRHATLIPARHYGLLDRGAVAPGYRADLLVVDDVRAFRPYLVFKDGQLVAREEELVTALPSAPLVAANSIHCAPLDASAFQLPLASDRCPVIRVIPGQIVTRHESQHVHRQGGRWAFDPEKDVVLLASIERHRATGQIGLALVAGLGLRRPGALGSSVAHDSHNLLVAGNNAVDMLACVQALETSGGGFVVTAQGSVCSQLPLPIAGLLSSARADVVCRQLQQVSAAARALGCELPAPFGTLSFLALPVIPELRITAQGLFDVTNQQFLRW